MTRWMHPPELERQLRRDRFDPVALGHRLGLSRDLSLAIWDRVRAEATDREGRLDALQAERRFVEIAARIAARGGRLTPDVGRLTRVETERPDGPVAAWPADELAPRMPGRDTLVAAEARRRDAQDPLAPVVEAAAAAPQRSVLPARGEVLQARRLLDLRAWAPPTRQPAMPEAAGALAAQVQRTFGGGAGDVAITPDSSRPLAAGAEGVAVGEQVYLAPGYYDLTTVEGRERLGHEVAHVLQQRRGRDLPGRLGLGERAGLEAEADRAGQAFARGQRFAVQGRAPAQIALFKGAAPTKAPAATTTTIDLKATGGRIDPKPPAPDPAAGASTGGDPAAAPASGGKDKSKAKEQLIVSYGSVQATNPFTLERDDSGAANKLTGSGTISLPASRYLKKLDLDISLGPDGYVVAKLKHSATTTVQIGGLEVKSGTLTAAIDHGPLSYALDGANLALPRNIGEGSLSIQGNGDQDPAFDASLSINVPKMQPATMSFHADATGYRAEGSTGIDIKMASGNVTFSLEKVGDDKALWSAAGTVGYNSERLSGQVSVQYNADGELSGEGTLNFQIADFLTGQATVAVDKEGHVTVNGEIRPPNETQLFPEKKIENTFFHKEVDFPIWGITIPAIGSVGLIAFIEGSMGYRVGVGAGVMRDIVLSGQYSTDPNVQPTFGITGEIFIPAFAELLISIGGGVKLDAFIADIGGGIKVDGRAGFYGGLSVRPSLAYEGGKYKLSGQAILGGDVGLQATLDAFIKLHVGKWMFSWEKEWDWKLGEWDKWLGLNLGMEADLDYTLGQPLSPDIFKLKKPDSLDVQGIAQSAVPKDGMPAQGAKGAQHEHEEFHAKGGGAAAPASGPAAQPQVAGTPAGASGHKNQDPKGKTVKPGAPPKKAPAKKAKGKGKDQTGPDPKNTSKPTVPKLDATPIVEPFTMHGEPHQLIVQLGEGGHVDMASKRERLSVKIGHAVGKLTAKRASRQQIAALKELGALAKKGDQMVATAKTHDKDGTKKATVDIHKFGETWKVPDLDVVAVKPPVHLAVGAPVHLAAPGRELVVALLRAHGGQEVFIKPTGDVEALVRQILEQHKGASFDYDSATLTLPAPHVESLQAAHSLEQIGSLLAQQTGVTKIVLALAGKDLEFTGAIGKTGTALATAKLPVVTSLAAQAVKIRATDELAKDLEKAKAGPLVNHGGDAKAAIAQILKHNSAHLDVATGHLTLPPVTAPGPKTPLKDVGEHLAQETGVPHVIADVKDENHQRRVTLKGAIDPSAGTVPPADLAHIQADTQNREARIKLAQALDMFQTPNGFTAAQWKEHFFIGDTTVYEDLKNPEIVKNPQGNYVLTPLKWKELKPQILERFRRAARKDIGTANEFGIGELRRFCEGDPQLPKPPNVPREYSDDAALETVFAELTATKDIEPIGDKPGRYVFLPVPSRRYWPKGWDGSHIRRYYYENGSNYDNERDIVCGKAHADVMSVFALDEQAEVAQAAGDLAGADKLRRKVKIQWKDLWNREIVWSKHPDYPGLSFKAMYNNTSAYHADHSPSLAQMWETGENDVGHVARWRTCDTGLRPMWGQDNVAKGSKGSVGTNGQRFLYTNVQWVGPNFCHQEDPGGHNPWNAGNGARFRESM